MPGHKDVRMPTQKTLPLVCLTQDGVGQGLVRSSLALTQLNGRLYRQCRTYDVSFSEILGTSSSTDAREYHFYTLPNTWFVYGAIKYAYDTYIRNHAEELEAGIRFSRWHDFMINEQDPDGTWDELRVVLQDGSLGESDSTTSTTGWGTITGDETISDSSVSGSDGTAEGFNLMGIESNSYNIFSEFAKKLKYGHAADESITSDQPYEGLLDLKDADDMVEKGDQAPYDRDWSVFLPDAGNDDQKILCWQDSIYLTDDGFSRSRTRQFTAPLGLVWVNKKVNGTNTDFSTSVPEICLHVKGGDYKGIHSHSLSE